jgi:hypothetical protein
MQSKALNELNDMGRQATQIGPKDVPQKDAYKITPLKGGGSLNVFLEGYVMKGGLNVKKHFKGVDVINENLHLGCQPGFYKF